MKSLVYEKPVNSAEELVARISAAAGETRNTPEMSSNVRCSMKRRCEACITCGGPLNTKWGRAWREKSDLHFLSRENLDKNHFVFDIIRHITEKNMPPFFWCLQLMIPAPQYLVFPATKGTQQNGRRCNGRSLQHGY
ncbi:hypothetical protein TNCV_2412131 [Trichonephila clavipes]|nr:hypothetical protein TNCV_2412131 [Trichonephila clavipes]